MLIDTWRTPGRWCPGDVAAHGSPCSPAESVQREGVPCATPAKLLYCAMHPATLAVSVKPSTAAQRRPHADSKTLDTSSAPIQYSQLNCICHVFSLVSGREVGGSADHHITTPQAFSLSLCLHLLTAQRCLLSSSVCSPDTVTRQLFTVRVMFSAVTQHNLTRGQSALENWTRLAHKHTDTEHRETKVAYQMALYSLFHSLLLTRAQSAPYKE